MVPRQIESPALSGPPMRVNIPNAADTNTPALPKAGQYTLKAVATDAGGARFASGYQEIEYPHVQRRQIMKPAEAVLNVGDVKATPGLAGGYVVGGGGRVAAAIVQLGGKEV